MPARSGADEAAGRGRLEDAFALGAVVGMGRLADAATRDHRVGDPRGEQPDGAQRVVVAGIT